MWPKFEQPDAAGPEIESLSHPRTVESRDPGHSAMCGCSACALRGGEGETGPVYAYLNLGDRGGTAFNGKTSFTLDQAVNRLTSGEGGWGVLGQPFVATYAFRSAEPANMPSETTGFTRFN
ncbi:MAG: hypothetical protein ACK5T8_03130, partial [Alphaproteobacteria bacterium]